MGTPSLRVAKSVDLSAVGLGDTLTYTLTASNVSDTSSRDTTVFDRVPDDTRFLRAYGPENGSVWFSTALPPTLPDRLNDPLAVTSEDLATAGFVRGADQGDGSWLPTNGTPTWVAFTLDSGAPAHFGAGLVRTMGMEVEVTTGVSGATISNRAIVDAAVMLGAISPTVRTLVSDEPYLELASSCGGVVTSPGTFVKSIQFKNASTSDVTGFSITESLPLGTSFVSSEIIWNELSTAWESTTVTPSVAGRTITWDFSGTGLDLGSLEGGTIYVTIAADAGLSSGSLLSSNTMAVAANAANPAGANFYSACTTAVANADITVTALVDRAAPIGGDAVLLTIRVRNGDAHYADNLGLSVTLPTELSLNGPTASTNTSYRFTDGSSTNNQPIVAGQTLTWEAPDRLLIGPATEPGRLEGNSNDVVLRIPLRVAPGTPQGTSFSIAAAVTTTTGQGLNILPDATSVDLRTPLPDLTTEVDAPTTADAGDAIQVAIPWRNLSRQASDAAAVVLSLPPSIIDPTVAGATLIGVSVPSGTTAYYSDAPLGTPPPSFDGPGSTGWWADPASLAAPTTYIAVDVGAISGLMSPPDIILQLALSDPETNALALPGTAFETCATIAQRVPSFGLPADADPTNDAACGTTTVPGVNIAAVLTCDPSGAFPGVLPGGATTAILTLVNRGTSPAYGLKLVHGYTPDFNFDSAEASTATITTAGGDASTPVDLSGAPLAQSIPQTQAGTTWFVGTTADEGDADHYRRVGLRPGDRVAIPVRLIARGAAQDGDVLDATLTVTTDYQIGWTAGVHAEETLLVDNLDRCEVVARRADLALDIEAIDVAPRRDGDDIQWQVAYDNLGSTAAQDVVITHLLEDGQTFVTGSLLGVPEGFRVEYASSAGWGYPPSGEADPAVTGFRLIGDTLAAPVGGGWNLAGDALFEGSHGTVSISPDGRVGATTDGASFMTPIIPADGRAIDAWQRINLGEFAAEAGDGATITVIDAATGELVPGFIDIPVDTAGFVDLSGLSTDVQAIRLAVNFTGGSPVCDYTSPDPIELSSPRISGTRNWRVASARGGNARGDAQLYMANNPRRHAFLTLKPDGTRVSESPGPLATSTNIWHSPVRTFTNTAVVQRYNASGALTLEGVSFFRRANPSAVWKHVGDAIDTELAVIGQSDATVVEHRPSGRVLALARKGSELALRVMIEADDGVTSFSIPMISSSPTLRAIASTGLVLVSHAISPHTLHAHVPSADLASWSDAVTILPPTGFTWQGYAQAPTRPDGTFALPLRRTSDGRTRPFVLDLADPSAPVWTELPVPAAFANTSLEIIQVTTAGDIVSGSGNSAMYVVRETASGVFESTTLPTFGGAYMVIANYPRGGEYVGNANGDVAGIFASNRMVSLIRRTDTGFDPIMFGPLSGGGTPSPLVEYFPDTGMPLVQVSNHSERAAWVTWRDNGDGTYGELLLKAENASHSFESPAPGPDETVVIQRYNATSGAHSTEIWKTGGTDSFNPTETITLNSYDGYIQSVSGLLATGYYTGGPVNAQMPIVWGPGLPNDAGDGWGWVALPLPTNLEYAIPYYISADGFVIGTGYDNDTGRQFGVGWRPSPDGQSWTAELMVFEGSSEMAVDFWSMWGHNLLGAPPIRVSATRGGTAYSGLAYADPAAPGGFRVVAFPSLTGSIESFNPTMGVIAGAVDGLPTIARAEADGSLESVTLPYENGGVVFDSHDGYFAGLNNTAGGYVAAVWRPDGDTWTVHNLGTHTGKNMALLPGGDVVVATAESEVTLYRWDGAAYLATPLRYEDDPGYNYFFNSGPSSHSLFPFTMPALRDGLILMTVGGFDGPNRWAVFGLPEPGAAQAPYIELGEARGQMQGYLGDGDFMGGGSPLYYLWRVGPNASAVEEIPFASTADGFGGYDPDVWAMTGLLTIPRYGPQTTPFAFPEFDSVADVPASMEVIEGPAGSVFGKLQVNVNTQLHPQQGAEVMRFANRSGPDYLKLWGCRIVPSASFADITVDFRSAEPPAFVFTTRVEDLCMTEARATVSGTTSTPQSRLDNDSDSAAVPVMTSDIGVTVTPSQRLLAAPGEITWTATVDNFGAWPADGVSLVVTGWNGLNETVDIGSVPAGGRVVQTFTQTVADTVPDGTSLRVGATVASDGIDCDSGNQIASASATVSNLPNAWVALEVPPTTRALSVFTITVRYGNDSDSPITAADIVATLPPSLQVVSGATSLTGVDLAPGDEGFYTFDVTSGCADAETTAALEATITAAGDAFASDDRDDGTLDILAPAGELGLRVTPSRSRVAPGGRLRWTAVLTHLGTAPVSGVSVSAEVPAGTAYVPGSLTLGTQNAGVIDVSFAGSLQPGDVRTFSFETNVTADEGAVINGVATAIANDACDVTAFYAAADVETPTLIIDKVADRATVCGDGPITWTIEVTNPGTEPIDEVTIHDAAPAGTTYIAGSMVGGDSRTHVGGALTWSFGAIAAGDTVVVAFQTTSPTSQGQQNDNIATVAVSGIAVGDSNVATVQVDCDGGLGLTWSWDGECLAEGADATVTLAWENTGMAPEDGVVVTDRLPVGVDPVLPVAGATWDAGPAR